MIGLKNRLVGLKREGNEQNQEIQPQTNEHQKVYIKQLMYQFVPVINPPLIHFGPFNFTFLIYSLVLFMLIHSHKKSNQSKIYSNQHSLYYLFHQFCFAQKLMFISKQSIIIDTFECNNQHKNKLNQQKLSILNFYFKFLPLPSQLIMPPSMISKPTLQIKIFTLALLLVLQTTSLRIHNAQNGNMHFSVSSLTQKALSHSQVDRPIYDEQRYLVDLAQKQNVFKQKVTEIQNGFAGINMMLNDTNLSQNQKSIKLSEALADERDSLISAQTQLNLPYELKSCQCLNLTQQKKLDLSRQLSIVKSKISELEKSSIESNKHCKSHDCPLIKQLSDEIQMMKSYQTIMENTINSKCCEVIKYAYRDNLDGNNWHWGNTTQTDYQAQAFERQQLDVDTKLQPCPYTQPWVKIQQNTCFACPADKTLFNVGTRQCEKDCTTFSKNPAFILNLTTHLCGYNTNCPSGQYFDETSRKCSTAISYTNESSCPPSRPFWDPLSYSCQSCPSQTPFFDPVLKSCRKCDTNETWNENTRICESSHNCEEGYYFDTTNGKCVSQTNDTHSLCPPERPFWNEVTYSCDECSNQKPFYDPVKKVCRVCNDNQIFNQYTKKCALKDQNITCAADQFYNSLTRSCQKRGTTSMCPPSTPYWDSVNFKCLQCPSSTPSFNDKTRQCEGCPATSKWSNDYQQCIQSCSSGEQWNQDYRKCIKTNQSCPQKYAFSYEMNECIEINCDEKNPFWNSTANLCQPCPLGTVYNYLTANCQKDSRSGNVSVCHEDKPLWNPEYMRCEPCPNDKVWNSLQTACLSPSVNSHSHNHHLSIKMAQQVHAQTFKEGHVYGNQKALYQYHDLSAYSSELLSK